MSFRMKIDCYREISALLYNVWLRVEKNLSSECRTHIRDVNTPILHMCLGFLFKKFWVYKMTGRKSSSWNPCDPNLIEWWRNRTTFFKKWIFGIWVTVESENSAWRRLIVSATIRKSRIWRKIRWKFQSFMILF